jgi:hypothetical protein
MGGFAKSSAALGRRDTDVLVAIDEATPRSRWLPWFFQDYKKLRGFEAAGLSVAKTAERD